MNISRVITLLVALMVGCGTTPAQRGPLEQAACQLVTAFGGTAQEQSLCGTAADLIELGAIIATTRANAEMTDAGARKVGPASACKPIPDTTVCASEPELAAAIKTFKAAHGVK